MEKMIWFDMDGTIVDFYGVEGWLNDLINSNTRPYEVARPLHNMAVLARLMNAMSREGWGFGIISWTSKNGTEQFNAEVAEAKREWLAKHLPSVTFSEICIVPYGTNKWNVCKNGVLFDDEEGNRFAWGNGLAYEPSDIVKMLKALR